MRGDPASGPLLDAVRTVSLTPAHLTRNRVIAASHDDKRADVFRALRTQALLRLQVLGGRSLAIVSARDGEGKTLVASNLAFSLARRAEGPVVLVDLDLRRPSVHRTLGITAEHGIADVIEQQAELMDVLVKVDGLPLYVLPQPQPTTHASELTGHARTGDLLTRIADLVRDGYVVVDCPPILLTDESLMIQRFVDGCLLVVEQARTRRDDVQRVTELLDESKYLGSVINRAEAASTYSHFGYR